MVKWWEQMQEFIKRATPPARIADAVFEEGIRMGKLYIIPHKETAQVIKNRFDGIMNNIKGIAMKKEITVWSEAPRYGRRSAYL